MGEPFVSICAVAYNHAPYIRECLNGFLKQKTDFPFEILIHDDASTDGTGDIIREYAKKYPDIIRPMLETENQYSKGITNISGAFNFPRARGKYIALSDCDDYWCDPEKLRVQTDYMESHPECMLTVHCAKTVNENGEFVNRNLMRPYPHDCLLTSEELVDKAGSFPFASMLLRAEIVKTLPDYYVRCPVGDRPLELMAAAKGYAFYFDRPMSVYRFNGAGSWTNSMMSGDYKKKQNEYAKKMREMYESFDRETGGQFRREAVSASHRVFYLTQVNLRNWSVIYDRKYWKFYQELPGREKFFCMFEHRLPHIYQGVQGLYHKMKKPGR
jgi:glycosyltransferase involved in cell wall biosynthesis